MLGGSYGGYMTSWIVSHTDRFKAACSERAVNNLYTAVGSSDIFWAFKGYFGAFAHEATDAWLERSPSVYAEQIETPLLIMHSEGDLRCSVEQAEHLFTIMRLLGKEVEFVRFSGEGHEMSRSGLAGASRAALRGAARLVRPVPELTLPVVSPPRAAPRAGSTRTHATRRPAWPGGPAPSR